MHNYILSYVLLFIICSNPLLGMDVDSGASVSSLATSSRSTASGSRTAGSERSSLVVASTTLYANIKFKNNSAEGDFCLTGLGSTYIKEISSDILDPFLALAAENRKTESHNGKTYTIVDMAPLITLNTTFKDLKTARDSETTNDKAMVSSEIKLLQNKHQRTLRWMFAGSLVGMGITGLLVHLYHKPDHATLLGKGLTTISTSVSSTARAGTTTLQEFLKKK